MNVLAEELLAAKRKLTPATWQRSEHGEFARDARGRVTDPCSPSAATWCALGALRSVTGESQGLAETYLNRAAVALIPASAREAATLGEYPAGHVNDTTDLETVHQMFDMAIRIAQEDP